MTAYGRANLTTSSGDWIVEIHSVNRKALEVQISLPPNLLFLDLEIRKLIAPYIVRGQVTIRINLTNASTQSSLQPLLQLKKYWSDIAVGLGYDPNKEIGFNFLINQLGTQTFQVDEAMILGDLNQAIKAALKPFEKMKIAEGKALLKDLEARTEIIGRAVKEIEQLYPHLKSRFEDRLVEKLKTFQDQTPDDRLLREIALFAEKIDVTEEITRLYSHAEQFQEKLISDDLGMGRTLDFLTQEMGREINTLMAKSGGTEISKKALLIKAEIDKMREQVQNIE
jgi:uncharacterized protein (TIGR00255 family)